MRAGARERDGFIEDRRRELGACAPRIPGTPLIAGLRR